MIFEARCKEGGQRTIYFITTGFFTSEAKKEAIHDGAPALDLIDGDALIEKLKDLGLGLIEKIIKDYEVNENGL